MVNPVFFAFVDRVHFACFVDVLGDAEVEWCRRAWGVWIESRSRAVIGHSFTFVPGADMFSTVVEVQNGLEE